MSTVIAALDASAAAGPVLEVALAVGELIGAEVEAVHVGDGPVKTPGALAERAGVALKILDGPVEAALLAALADPAVAAAVLGARSTPAGRRPAGHTTLHMASQARKPVVIVPPDALPPGRPLRRLVLPLEGTAASSRPVLERLYPLIGAQAELVVLHVFTPDTTPRILDRPYRDLAMRGDEFRARHLPQAARVEWRAGPVGASVVEACEEEGADLVVLSWSQDASAERAAVVREVLGRSRVPVILMPAADTATAVGGTRA